MCVVGEKVAALLGMYILSISGVSNCFDQQINIIIFLATQY